MPRISKQTLKQHFIQKNDLSTCKYCAKELKGNRSFNLKVHLKKLHDIDIKISKEDTKEEQSTLTPVAVPVPGQYRVKKLRCKINKTLLVKSYLGLLLDEGVSLKTLNSHHMQNLVNPMRTAIEEQTGERFCLNTNNLTKTLSAVAAKIVESIKNESKNKLILLNLHSSKDLLRNIFIISAQFVSRESTISKILGIIELKAQPDMAHLADELFLLLKNYEIDVKQVVAITLSENCATKAMQMDTQSSTGDSHDDNESENDNDLDASRQLNIENNTNAAYFGKIDHISRNNFELCLTNIKIHRNSAYIAQQCFLDGLQLDFIRDHMRNCRNIVKFLKKNLYQFRESYELRSLKMPQLDCPMSWGSTYQMIRDVKNSKDVLEPLDGLISHKNVVEENFELTEEFWNFIDAYFTAYKALYKCIVRFQDEQYHYGNFYAQWLICSLLTKQIAFDNKNHKNALNSKLCSHLLESIELRTQELFSNKNVLACLYLDPRFHNLLELDQKEKAICQLKQLWQKFANVCMLDTSNPTISAPDAASVNIKIEKHEDDDSNDSDNADVDADDEDMDELNQTNILDSFLKNKFTLSATKSNINVELKIEQLSFPYQVESSINVLDFWKERSYSDPELFTLSKICFGIQCSDEIAIDSAFSALRTLMQHHNGQKLNVDTLQSNLLVKLYPKFLDEAIFDTKIFQEE